VRAGLAVRADRTRLVQILTNLVSNAVKYGRPPVVVEARRRGGDIEIDVCDNGMGLADDLAPTVFERFVRGAGVGNRGTGLGLFIVRELARLQGGDAWYEPGPDGGARFAVLLPGVD
jgi:signal transduction histidine kinase